MITIINTWKRSVRAAGAARKAALLCTGLAASLAAPSAALAGTDSSTFQVTATVSAACIVSASDLAFGAYNPTSLSPTDGSSTLAVTCTNGTPYTVALNAGVGTGASVTTRKMTSGANTLSYSLYQDISRSTVWGLVGGALATGTGSGAAQSMTMYGRIPAAQTAPAGSYTDTVTVTVAF